MNEALAQLADVASCAAGDLHTLHLNVVGPEFDAAHHVLEAWYEAADDDYDSLAEWTRATASPAPNRNESATRLSYQSVEAKLILRMTAYETARVVIENYLDALSHVFSVLNDQRESLSIGICNWLQTRIEYWAKQTRFFNDARLSAPTADEPVPGSSETAPVLPS